MGLMVYPPSIMHAYVFGCVGRALINHKHAFSAANLFLPSLMLINGRQD